MTHARTRRDVFADLRVEGHQPDAVLLLKHQIRETGSQPGSVFVFARAAVFGPAVLHRSAEIEQQRGSEIRLLLVLADVKAIASTENAPVDVPDFVARDVLPVLLEFDAEPLVRRAVQPRAKALDHLPREELEIADLLQISRREKIGDVSHGPQAEAGQRSDVRRSRPSSQRLGFSSRHRFHPRDDVVHVDALGLGVEGRRQCGAAGPGAASASMSSMVTWKRPCKTARHFAREDEVLTGARTGAPFDEFFDEGRRVAARSAA